MSLIPNSKWLIQNFNANCLFAANWFDTDDSKPILNQHTDVKKGAQTWRSEY